MSDIQKLKSEQQSQDGEYWFPYHYVARFKGDNFRHYYLDTWAINYVSPIVFVLDKIRTGTHKTIVEIGCGDGRVSRGSALAETASPVP